MTGLFANIIHTLLLYLQIADQDSVSTSRELYGSYKRWLSRFKSPEVLSLDKKQQVMNEDVQRAFIMQATTMG